MKTIKLLSTASLLTVASCSFLLLSSNAAYSQNSDDIFTLPEIENIDTSMPAPMPVPTADEMSDTTEIDFGVPDVGVEMAAPELGQVPELPAAPSVPNMPEVPSATDGEIYPEIEAETVMPAMDDMPSIEPPTVIETQPVMPSEQALVPSEEVVSEAAANNDVAVPVPATEEQPVLNVRQLPESPIASQQTNLSGEQVGGVEAANDFFPDDKYYSADRGVTTSDLDAPGKADPDKDPGSKFVIMDVNSVKGSIDSRFSAAQRALDLQRYESALLMFDALYSDNPRDHRVLMGRAVALQMSGQEEKAIKSYEELLDLAPNNPKVLINLMGLLAKQNPSIALERLKALYEKNPGNASVVAQMGVAEAGRHNFKEAVKFMGVAVSLEPNNPQHYFNLAVIYDKNRDYDKAIRQYEQALEIDSLYRTGSLSRDVVYDRLSRLRKM